MREVTMNPLLLFALLAGIVLLGGAFTFWQVFWKSERAAREAYASGEAVRDFQCPRCRRPMARGCSFGGIGWRGDLAPPIKLLTVTTSLLPNTLSMSLRVRVNRAWRCESCKLLLIDHRRLLSQQPRG